MLRLRIVFIAVISFLNHGISLAQQGNSGGVNLSDAADDFSHAQAESDRFEALSSKVNLRFQLQFNTRKVDKDGPSEMSWVNWDGENLIVDSERFVYVSTPYRAFLLSRENSKAPLAIQFITPISPTPRSIEEIIKFDLKVGDGYVAASRPTELRRYNCQYGTFAPREGAEIERATRQPNGLLRFDYRRQAKADEFLVREDGFCIVDPAQGHSLISANLNMIYKRPTSNSTMASQFEYYPPQGALPRLIKSYKHQQLPTPGNKNSPHYQNYNYSDYSVEPVPKEKLTLEYYGLPDPMKSHRSFWGWPAALIGSGVFAVVLFFFVRYRRRRMQ